MVQPMHGLLDQSLRAGPEPGPPRPSPAACGLDLALCALQAVQGLIWRTCCICYLLDWPCMQALVPVCIGPYQNQFREPIWQGSTCNACLCSLAPHDTHSIYQPQGCTWHGVWSQSGLQTGLVTLGGPGGGGNANEFDSPGAMNTI